jgi:hypothetical protein
VTEPTGPRTENRHDTAHERSAQPPRLLLQTAALPATEANLDTIALTLNPGRNDNEQPDQDDPHT